MAEMFLVEALAAKERPLPGIVALCGSKLRSEFVRGVAKEVYWRLQTTAVLG